MTDEYLGDVPETFFEQVRQALAQLYNFSYLQQHPLVQYFVPSLKENESAGHSLRRMLIQTIEALNPGENISFRSPDGRIYNLLKLYYIDRMTLQEVALELAISERQVYRDLRQGQGSVATLLWNSLHVTPAEAAPHDLSPFQIEVERLRGNFHAMDLGALLHMAYKAVQRLAQQYETPLNITLPDAGMAVKVNVPIAQQLLINLLSFCIKQAHSNPLTIALMEHDHEIVLSLTFVESLAASDNPLQAAHIRQLAEQLKWQMRQQAYQGSQRFQLFIPINRFTLMVIDDNEALAELVVRYLAGSNYHIVAAHSSTAGLQRAREALPTAILLDVMMPEMDGWEFLQRLRTYPETEGIPVIICSVLHDPELAYSLGASYVIPKPVTQDSLLEAFHTLELL